ncbi:MAG: hypothetical protein AAFX76_11810 [Planctomycetota bacterium]
MSETPEDKIKRLYEFARGVRQHGASVEIETERGKETRELKPTERRGSNSKKTDEPSSEDAA